MPTLNLRKTGIALLVGLGAAVVALGLGQTGLVQTLELKLYDVSVVTYPANPATVIQVRNERVRAAARSGVNPPPGAPLEYFIAQADRLRRSGRG